MSKYTSIIQELKQINDAKFQIICDLYLASEYEGDLTSFGTSPGKEKVKKGKPDAYIKSMDGKYVLAEYTTRDSSTKSSFLKKLRTDLSDCMNLDKFHITKDQVKVIVLCFNSQLDIADREALTKFANDEGFQLEIVSIGTIAQYLYTKGKSVAKDFLGIPFDTGQILDKQQFLKQYHKRNLATPLDDILMGRELELTEIIDSINNNSITIIKGAAGVGKSRLAIQAIDCFTTQRANYIPYYIVQKNNNIFEDLSSYVDSDKKYILFIDDANRQIENLMSVIDKYIEDDKDSIKIIITVRDYAKDMILEKCKPFNPNSINIDKLHDNYIESILTSEKYNIQDRKIIDRIMFLCKGNPRLAIMSAIVVKDNKDIKLLEDVSIIYQEYFEGLLKENEIFKDKNTQKVLGVLSFFNAMDLRSQEVSDQIRHFKIPQDIFIETIYALEDLEIVEVYMKDTVKVSEQVLATYFFYKVFIKDKLLSFEILTKNYVETFSWRMKDCINPSLSAFGKQNVLGNIRKTLEKYWAVIKENQDKTLNFLEIFGKFFPSKVFLYASEQIAKEPEPINENNKYGFLTKSFGTFSKLSSLLETFFESDDNYELLTSVELAINYSRKLPYTFDGTIKSLCENLRVSENSIQDNLRRQQLVFDKLLSLKTSHVIFNSVFYQLYSKTILSTHFINEAYYKDENGIYRLNTAIQKLRDGFWNTVIEDFNKDRDLITEVIIKYINEIQHSNQVINNYDYPYFKKLFELNLDPTKYADNVIVNKYLDACNEKGLSVNGKNLRDKFTNLTYQISEILNPVQYYEREIRSGNYEESEKRKLLSIRKQMPISRLEDFTAIFPNIKEIVEYPYRDKLNVQIMLDFLIAGVFMKSFDLGFEVLKFYLSNGNVAVINAGVIFRQVFKKHPLQLESFYEIINTPDYPNKEYWIQLYFEFLKQENVTNKVKDNLIAFYKNRKSKHEIHYDMFSNFLTADPEIYKHIFEISTDRYLENNENKYEIGYQFFQKSTGFLENNLQLCKKAFLQQTEIKKNHDFDQEEFIEIFKRDKHFVSELLVKLISDNRYSFTTSPVVLSKLWAHENGEDAIYDGLVTLLNIQNTHHHEHIATIFFVNMEKSYFEKALNLLRRFVSEFRNHIYGMNLVLDIARNCLRPFHMQIIKHILTLNNDFSFFKQLEFHNHHFSSNGESLWSDFKANELRNIYEAIKQLDNISNYSYHLELIERRIDYEENHSINERKLKFMGYR